MNNPDRTLVHSLAWALVLKLMLLLALWALFVRPARVEVDPARVLEATGAAPAPQGEIR